MKRKGTKLGKAIIAGLKEAIAYERGKISLRTTELELPPAAHEFSKSEVKKLREDILHVSQPIFAQIMNVSPATIKAWEQGAKRPSGSANRLLEIVRKRPSLVSELV